MSSKHWFLRFANWGKCEPGSLNGVDQEVGYDDDLVNIQVMKGRTLHKESKQFWSYRGTDLRLSSGVRGKDTCCRSGIPLSGKGPSVIVAADVVSFRSQCLSAEDATGAALKDAHIRTKPSKLGFHLYVIKSPQSSSFIVRGNNYSMRFVVGYVGSFVSFHLLSDIEAWVHTFQMLSLSIYFDICAVDWLIDLPSILLESNITLLNVFLPKNILILSVQNILFRRKFTLNYRVPMTPCMKGRLMDLNAFIRTADPRKVRIVKRTKAENVEPIVTVAKHRTVTPLSTLVVRPSRDLSESVEREFGRDMSGSAGRGPEDASVGGYSDAEPIVPITAGVAAETGSSRAKRPKKKRVVHESGDTPAASHPPKRLRTDYGNTSGFVIRGKSPGVLNRLLRASQLTVEQGVTALPTLPFITSSVTASPLEEGRGHTDFVTASTLRTVGPSERFVVLSDSSHYSSAKSADAEVDSLTRSAAPVMAAATTVTTSVSAAATTVVALTNVNKDKNVPTPSIFAVSSSSEKTDRTLSLFAGRSGSDFVAGSIRVEGDVDTSLQEVYIPEWTMTKGFELNDGRSCDNMIDHFTHPAFFKTVRGIEHEQLFVEFNVSAARNLSLSSEVRMHAEYNILEMRKWRSLAEERNDLLQVKDKEIEELKSQLLQARDESMEVAQLRTWVASLEAIESSLRGEVAFAKEHKGLLEQERSALNLKVTSLESTFAEKDRELSDLETSSSSLRSYNQRLVDQVRELETSSACLREKLKTYERSMKQLEEFQDNLMKPLEARLAEIDADFTRCCMYFQDSFHSHLLNVIAGRRWLLAHGMRLLMAKCLNSSEYMEAIGNAFGRAIKKGMQEGLAAGIEHGQAGRCLNDLEAYNPSAEDDFNSAVQALRSLDFSLLQELSAKRDANTFDIMNLLRLDDAVAEVLGMTGLQPDVSQLMVPVCRKQDQVVVGSQTLSVALDICHGRVRKMERNLTEYLPILKDVFTSIDHPLSVEALTVLLETFIEPPVATPATNVLSTVVIRPTPDSFLSVEDYENPHLADAVPGGVIPEPRGEGKVEGSNDADVGDLVLSQLEGEARDAVL
ncbi:hypothetical protein Tco_0610201 [Tanacetum coccineum]